MVVLSSRVFRHVFIIKGLMRTSRKISTQENPTTLSNISDVISTSFCVFCVRFVSHLPIFISQRTKSIGFLLCSCVNLPYHHISLDFPLCKQTYTKAHRKSCQLVHHHHHRNTNPYRANKCVCVHS